MSDLELHLFGSCINATAAVEGVKNTNSGEQLKEISEMLSHFSTKRNLCNDLNISYGFNQVLLVIYLQRRQARSIHSRTRVRTERR